MFIKKILNTDLVRLVNDVKLQKRELWYAEEVDKIADSNWKTLVKMMIDPDQDKRYNAK